MCGFEPTGSHSLELFNYFYLSFMSGQVDFSDLAILCNRPSNCCQQNLKCFDEPLFSLGFIKSNNNSVNYPACSRCSSKWSMA